MYGRGACQRSLKLTLDICRYTVDTRPLWDQTPPVIESYKGVWLQPWKLFSMIGQFHDLLLALYLVCNSNRVIGDAGLPPATSHENGHSH